MRARTLALLGAALFVLAACGSAATPSDPVGSWDVTYGALTTVAITNSGGTYTITATAPVEVIGSRCYIPAGTVLATFTGNNGSYAGEHGLWFTSNCSFDRQASVTLALDPSGQKLSVSAGLGGPVVFTRSLSAPINPLLILAILVVLALAATAGFVLLRRRGNRAPTQPAT